MTPDGPLGVGGGGLFGTGGTGEVDPGADAAGAGAAVAVPFGAASEPAAVGAPSVGDVCALAGWAGDGASKIKSSRSATMSRNANSGVDWSTSSPLAILSGARPSAERTGVTEASAQRSSHVRGQPEGRT